MRKTLMAGVIASVFALGGTASAAPLILDLNGAAAGGTITATALDWTQTSFLAQGGNQAIANFLQNQATGSTLNTSFDVYTHAKLIGYTPAGASQSTSLPVAGGEITIVAKFTETVTNAVAAAGFATFATTGQGWVEMYYSSAANSNNLTGFGFDDGTLIMRGTGVTGDVSNFATGAFFNTGFTNENLDSFGANDYSGQKTVNGFGSQSSISFGSTGFALDSNFIKSQIVDFSILFNNISIGLPYNTVDPSHCFNTTAGAASNASITAGTATGNASECDNAIVNGLYSAQGASGGYVPVIGAVNGAFGLAQDFIAQTDFNSAVTGTAPEPGSIALMGLALGALGLASRRRRT